MPDGVSVLVMLGNDKANMTLDQMGTPGTTLPGTTRGRRDHHRARLTERLVPQPVGSS